MPKRISSEVEKRAVYLYAHERLSIPRVRAALASEGITVGINWIYRKIHAHGVTRSHSQAMEFAMNERRISCVCLSCSQPFLGKQVNEKYCEVCAPTLQAHKRIYLYGMPESKFQELLIKQRHRCAVCDRRFDEITPPKSRRSSVVVDHAHDSNSVRGLLCHECNIAVGYVEKHSRHTLNKILDYLKGAHRVQVNQS